MLHPYEHLLAGCLWYRLNENAVPGCEFTGEGVERNRSVREHLSLPFSPLVQDRSEEGWHQLHGRSPWSHLSGFPAPPAAQSCVSLQCPTAWPHHRCEVFGFTALVLLLAGRPHFDKCPHIIGFHPSFARALQEEGKPRPQPSCPACEDWRARLAGTLLFQQNRASQCCWLLCCIFPDRALAIKIDAIIHMDSCNCKQRSKSKNRIQSLTQTYPQSVKMWHIGSVSVPNYECRYLLFFWTVFMIATFTVN